MDSSSVENNQNDQNNQNTTKKEEVGHKKEVGYGNGLHLVMELLYVK